MKKELQRTYVGFVRDHSGSMRGLGHLAMNDFNLMVDGFIKEDDDTHRTFMATVKCGVGWSADVVTESKLVPLSPAMKIFTYDTDGSGTPLWDSVGAAIEELEIVPTSPGDGQAFLVMVVTDGYENRSKKWSAKSIAAKIAELQKTDVWTFTFRVPRGHKEYLVGLGIPENNVIEWEQTEAGIRHSTVFTQQSTTNFVNMRKMGDTQSTAFYSNVADVKESEIKAVAEDVTSTVEKFWVSKAEEGVMIKDFVEKNTNRPYMPGSAMYQLTKPVKVQDHKAIAIRDRATGKVYAGHQARKLMNLPVAGQVNLKPGYQGKYDVFIQSTSVNRKLMGETTVLVSKHGWKA